MLRPVHRQAVAAPPLTAATAGCAAPRTGLPGPPSPHALPALQPVLSLARETTPCPRRPHPRRARHAPCRPRPPTVPPGAARPHRPIRRTRISGIRTALIAGVLALIVLVIFIAQNAQAVKLSFLGA